MAETERLTEELEQLMFTLHPYVDSARNSCLKRGVPLRETSAFGGGFCCRALRKALIDFQASRLAREAALTESRSPVGGILSSFFAQVSPTPLQKVASLAAAAASSAVEAVSQAAEGAREAFVCGTSACASAEEEMRLEIQTTQARLSPQTAAARRQEQREPLPDAGLENASSASSQQTQNIHPDEALNPLCEECASSAATAAAWRRQAALKEMQCELAIQFHARQAEALEALYCRCEGQDAAVTETTLHGAESPRRNLRWRLNSLDEIRVPTEERIPRISLEMMWGIPELKVTACRRGVQRGG